MSHFTIIPESGSRPLFGLDLSCQESRGEQRIGDAERSGGHQKKAGGGRAWEETAINLHEAHST
jgi:hypothetical protein